MLLLPDSCEAPLVMIPGTLPVFTSYPSSASNRLKSVEGGPQSAPLPRNSDNPTSEVYFPTISHLLTKTLAFLSHPLAGAHAAGNPLSRTLPARGNGISAPAFTSDFSAGP